MLMLRRSESKSTFSTSFDGWKRPLCTNYEQKRLLSGPGTPGSILVREKLDTSVQPDAACNPQVTRGLEVAHYKDFDNEDDVFKVSGWTRARSDYVGLSKVTHRCITVLNATSLQILKGFCVNYPNSKDSGWRQFEHDFSPYVKGVKKVRLQIGTWDSWARNWRQQIFIDDIVVTH